MREGFTFCGVDIADIGLHYAPDLENMYVYRPSDAQLHSETFDGHSGGYYYGSWREPKQFSLRCYIEESKLDSGVMSRIHNLFRAGRTGKLVFQRRPWCYYYATVSEVVNAENLNYENAVITIRMTAFYPFARGDDFTNLRTDPYHENIMANTAMYDVEGMDQAVIYTGITDTTNILLGNPGTERAQLGVAIQGEASGLTIKNITTDQTMKLVRLTKDITTNAGRELYVDGISGKTVLRNDTESKLAFLYHQRGFLELEPGYPALRDIYINYSGGSSVVVANILNENVIGKYLFVNKKWLKIIDQDEHELHLNGSIDGTGAERSTIMLLNELSISADDTMDIDKLEFIFKPTYA